MSLEEVLNRIKADPNVHSVFLMDEDMVARMNAEESTVNTSIGLPLDNKALRACMEKKCFVCIFCYGKFDPPKDHVMLMVDGNGKVVGFDIPPGKEGEYSGRGDLVWLSDDFVMDVSCGMGDDICVVMNPQKVTVVGASEGVSDPILFYPSTTTDLLLRAEYGIDPNDSRIASAVMAYDPI